jgi:hypothetical protein
MAQDVDMVLDRPDLDRRAIQVPQRADQISLETVAMFRPAQIGHPILGAVNDVQHDVG